MAAIDRRKHDIDVIERVLGTVRDDEERPDVHSEVVDLGVRPWLGGTSTSAVQMTIGQLEPSHDPEHDPDPES